MIQFHHERWDGTGYPEKLSGESIPSGKDYRDLDAYFALISDRPYSLLTPKKKLPIFFLKVPIPNGMAAWLRFLCRFCNEMKNSGNC
jgi:hypothetical protein